MPTDIPVTHAIELLKRGAKNEDIARELEGEGYTVQQISDAINQAQIKQGVNAPMPEIPESIPEDVPESPAPPEFAGAPPSYQLPTQQAMGYEETQALIEQIIKEKWKEFARGVGDIPLFKARVTDDLEAVKQEILRTQKRVEDLQVAVLGKVKDYNTTLLEVSNEMKALEQVFSKILEPLTSNVKELQRITESFRKK